MVLDRREEAVFRFQRYLRLCVVDLYNYIYCLLQVSTRRPFHSSYLYQFACPIWKYITTHYLLVIYLKNV